jgi:DNA-binding Lrp family transcriptional regulator
VVGFNYLNLSNDVIKEINDFFKNNPYVINMQECSQGVDLIIEYCQNNLSAFNKSYSEFIDKFSGFIDTKFIFPVIVKHEYPRKYLSRNVGSSDMVLCGDKEIPVLSIKEKSVLFHLMKNPLSSFTALAKRTGLSTRAIVELKKSLERKKVVRGYTCSFNLSGTQIRKELLFLRLTNKTFIQINKLTEFAKQNINVVNLIKLIGDYHLLLVIESLKEIDILSKIRSQFEVGDYLVVPVKKSLIQKFVPLIEI